MRIAIDAMGGDNAPDAIISGTVEALDELSNGDKLQLVGPKEIIEPKLPRSATNKIEIVDAPEVIAMDDPPIESVRTKHKSSIAIMAKMAKMNETDAVISAGNTGACIAAFQMRMRNLEGVNRPGIAVVFPTFGGPVTLCDVGANIASKPINLYQYAVMSSLYAQNVLKIEKPRVGIISIGSEEAKGNEIVKKARELLKSDPNLNFIGNIEGRDIFKATCDVAVCDGFVGNVVLKLTEGLVDGLFKAIKQELMNELLLALRFKSVMKKIYKKYDYNEYGGAPLLGVNGTAFICHGASESRTIKNAIFTAKKHYDTRINEKIAEYLSKSSVRAVDEQDE